MGPGQTGKVKGQNFVTGNNGKSMEKKKNLDRGRDVSSFNRTGDTDRNKYEGWDGPYWPRREGKHKDLKCVGSTLSNLGIRRHIGDSENLDFPLDIQDNIYFLNFNSG